MCGTGLTLGTNKCRSLGVFLKWEARVAAEKKVKAAEEARIRAEMERLAEERKRLEEWQARVEAGRFSAEKAAGK